VNCTGLCAVFSWYANSVIQGATPPTLTVEFTIRNKLGESWSGLGNPLSYEPSRWVNLDGRPPWFNIPASFYGPCGVTYTPEPNPIDDGPTVQAAMQIAAPPANAIVAHGSESPPYTVAIINPKGSVPFEGSFSANVTDQGDAATGYGCQFTLVGLPSDLSAGFTVLW
jgi:hypothetical protein